MKISSKKWLQFVYSAFAITLISFQFKAKFIIAFLTRKMFTPNILLLYAKIYSHFWSP